MVLSFIEGFDLYTGFGVKPELRLKVNRFWKNGKIISKSVMPPGHYTVRLMKIQTDCWGRDQHHWELIDV